MKSRIFYGWYIVAGALVMNFYFSALLIYGWSAFINPILATFGWTMVQLSLAASLRGLEQGIFNPLFGWVVDHYSARKLMILGLILNAAGVFILSQTRNLGMYYGGFLLMGLGGSLAMSIIPSTVIARWFKKDLGKATATFSMGYGIGGVAAPLVVKLIDILGWQMTLFYGAVVMLVMGIPIALLYRNKPSDYNLLPDGRATDTSNNATISKSGTEYGTSVKEALQTRAFWHLITTVFFQTAFLGILQIFIIPSLTNVGMTRTTAATVASLYTLASLFTRIPFGMLTDKIKNSHCIAISVGFQTVGIFIFWLLNGTSPFWMILAFAITYGIGLSGIVVLRPPILVEYFGTKNFGTIFALEGIFLTISAVISQPLAGWVFDTYQTYRPLWLGFFFFGLVALLVILTIPPPKRRDEPVVEAISARVNK